MIGPGAQINTLVDLTTPLTNGQVSIFIGAFPTAGAGTLVAGTAPSALNVTPASTPGSYFFGTNPNAIVVAGGAGSAAARVDAHGRDVIFNSPSANRTIVLNRNVLIKADPPGAGGELTALLPGATAIAGTPTATAAQAAFSMADTRTPPSSLADPAHIVTVLSNPSSATASQPVGATPSPGAQNSSPGLALGGMIMGPTTRQNPETQNSVNRSGPSSFITGMVSSINLEAAGKRFDSNQIVIFDEAGLRNDSTTAGDAMSSLRSGYSPIGFVDKTQLVSPPLKGTVRETNQRINLREGGVLFAPAKELVVHTKFGDVTVRGGAVALVVAMPYGVAIYDLHDLHSNDVSVNHHGRQIKLAPGTHVLLTNADSGRTLEDLNPLEQIGHRHLRSATHEETNEYASEFSIASAIAALKPIAGLQHSKSIGDRNLFNKIVKTAVVVHHMGSSKGGYQRIAPKQAYLSSAER